MYYCATCDRKMEPVTDINVHRCDSCGFEIGDTMKKYDCPDCCAEMHDAIDVRNKQCFVCHSLYTTTSLQQIERLKSQMHKMRNCENCLNSIEEYDGCVACLHDQETEERCITNDLCEWKG